MSAGIEFVSNVIPGSGRGWKLGFPTVNLEPYRVPTNLPHGVYAAYATIGDTTFDAVMHFGERPTFQDKLSCEVHVLDVSALPSTEELHIEVVRKLRDVKQCDGPEELKKLIETDIEKTKRILENEG